ncbi:GlsB/YeaQ/YmgE family stress response membrane protein [Terricaulis silvestris]|uniref:Transglycosylase associated protein n=1 Tax=Terricaulis silvestris TaxID=2686094 RepID=A0A6I6MTA1_9CAUL|nr:GlsB/YeaQ/YmgE family stress response membrane protein [Terricaulis silvestris]QGZ96666.1 Transglycosylase associated protein [Terricaulis silvestris]
MSAETLIIWIIVGAVAGWLAGLVVRGFGFGLLGNIIVGILGAILGGWLFGAIGFAFMPGIINTIITAFIGAVILLLIVRVIKRA